MQRILGASTKGSASVDAIIRGAMLMICKIDYIRYNAMRIIAKCEMMMLLAGSF